MAQLFSLPCAQASNRGGQQRRISLPHVPVLPGHVGSPSLSPKEVSCWFMVSDLHFQPSPADRDRQDASYLKPSVV